MFQLTKKVAVAVQLAVNSNDKNTIMESEKTKHENRKNTSIVCQ